jgi:hypothetical protein
MQSKSNAPIASNANNGPIVIQDHDSSSSHDHEDHWTYPHKVWC